MTDKTYHFISGLPRAGSTLMSSLLRQNPQCHARVASPVFELMHAVLPKLSRMSEFHSFFDNDIRKAVLRGLFESYYANNDKAVIFDSNRLWTTRLNILLTLFPKAHFICMVRDVHEILNSFECLFSRNPLETIALFGHLPGSSVYARIEHMMNSEIGIVGTPWLGLREAWFSEHAERIIIVDYETFIKKPEQVLAAISKKLQLKPFDYNFNDVSYSEDDYDKSLGIPNLHSVRKRIGKVPGKMVLPPDLVSKYSGHSFWKTAQTGKKSLVIK